MATSTIVQRLVPGEGESFSNRRQVETFLSSGLFSAKDWVSLDRAKTDEDRMLYVQSSSVTAPFDVIGVALDASTVAGQRVRVVIDGYVEGANVATGTPAGTALYISGTTGGRAANQAAPSNLDTVLSGTLGFCGIALEAASSNTCDVRVRSRF